MGLFGSTKIYVSSTIYNMAGDINKRPNYLKTLITSHTITDNGQKSIASSIQQGYSNGPGTKLRNFALWSQTNYPAIGVIRGDLRGQLSISPDVIAAQIPHDSNQTVSFQKIEVAASDFSYWATQWMMLNYPVELGTQWTSRPGELQGTIDIIREGGFSATITPSDFDPEGTYVYATYNLVTAAESSAIVPGSVQEVTSYPSLTGWTNLTSTSATQNVNLNKSVKTTKSYSDGRPDEVSVVNSSSIKTFNYYQATYFLNDYKGGTGNPAGFDQLYSVKKTMYLFRDGAAVPTTTVTETSEELNDGKLVCHTKTETTEDQLVVKQTYRIDTQDVSSQTYSGSRIYIYKLGSGNTAIDGSVTENTQDSFYFPFIPVRLDERFIDASYRADAFEQNKKAYKKFTGGRDYIKDVFDPVANNKALPDMKYVYLAFGVALNTKEMTGKEYLYRYFEKLYLTQLLSSGAYGSWKASQSDFVSSQSDWNKWRLAQNDPLNVLYGTPKPVVTPTYSAPGNTVQIHSQGSVDGNFNMQITWQNISKVSGSGKIFAGAKKGDFSVKYGGQDSFATTVYDTGRLFPANAISADFISISHQKTDDSWESIQITGLVHRNYIYDDGHFVEISARDALNDSEESGFLVPLHFGVFQELSTVSATQLSTACCYMVVNSYKIVKTGFFQSFFFKILLVVAVVAITVATGGTGGASVGLLGSNAAVGASLGLAGTAAIIAGAVANAIVAMILVKVISIGAVAIFGEKLGAIIGAIAGVIALQVGTSIQSGASLTQSFSTLMKADNIISMTSAVGSGVSGYIQAGAQETVAATQQLNKDYQTESAKYEKLYEDNFGINRAQLDPLGLFQDLNQNNVSFDVPSVFLERTLMTGSDVAELSMSLLSNFSKITLSTDIVL